MASLQGYLPSKQVIRFILVGGLNTLFGFLVYSGFILLDSPTWVALLGSNVAGIIFNFFTIGGMVFFDLSPMRFPLFVLSYTAVYVINLELIDLVIAISHGRIAAMEHGRIVAQAILVLPMAVLSYLILRNYVFRKTARP
jgi:putative flippase GtrA